MGEASTIAAQDCAVLEIDLDAVHANWRLLSDMAAPAECAAVVKADGYGLGAAAAGPVLQAAGCRTFFVAQIDEALALSAALPRHARIGVLNGLLPGTEPVYREAGLVPVLNSLDEISRWQRAAGGAGTPLPAFVHLDTGMNRLGLGPDETDRLIENAPARLAGISLQGWMSHLACADDAASPMTEAQRTRFAQAVRRLPAAPLSLANSSGIFRGRACHLDLVRPGCALFGVNPTPEAANPMRRTVTVRARVLQVRNVDGGMTVGYGAAHSFARRARIATVALGYADGFLRSGGGRGSVEFRGVLAPIVGRISMDLITVDVSDLPVTPAGGDFVTVIGDHRDPDAVARDAGTIGYEVLTALGRRYRRQYVGPVPAA